MEKLYLCKKCLCLFDDEQIETTKAIEPVKQLDVDSYHYDWVDTDCCPECESLGIVETDLEKVTDMLRSKFQKPKLTLTKFWLSKDRLVIQCDTKEKATTLCKALDNMYKKLRVDPFSLSAACWDKYKSETCYDNWNEFSDCTCYKTVDIKIYNFDVVDLEGYDE